jgi:hypothetical protein
MKKQLILTVTSAEYVKDYILRLTFNNGEVRDVDFVPLMQKGGARNFKTWTIFARTHLIPSL